MYCAPPVDTNAAVLDAWRISLPGGFFVVVVWVFTVSLSVKDVLPVADVYKRQTVYLKKVIKFAVNVLGK